MTCVSGPECATLTSPLQAASARLERIHVQHDIYSGLAELDGINVRVFTRHHTYTRRRRPCLPAGADLGPSSRRVRRIGRRESAQNGSAGSAAMRREHRHGPEE